MSASLLKGNQLAAEITENVKKEVEQLKTKGVITRLAAIQAGDNPGAKVYIEQQRKTCLEAGIEYEVKQLPADATQAQVLEYVEKLNADSSITGIILMMPLPKGVDARQVQKTISPSKDVEAMHPANLGKLVYGDTTLAPCTAQAAVELLKSSGIQLKGKEIVIVGHSEIVGKPIALILLQSQMESPTPTVCHIATQDLAFHTKRADIIFVAAGKPGLIRADMVKPGVVVIDIGINRVPVLDENGQPVLDEKGKPKKKIVGDADFDTIKEKASMITPVPGGVGLVTTALLLRNTVRLAKMASS